MNEILDTQIANLKKAIEAQKALRPVLGDEVVETALQVLQAQLMELETRALTPKTETRRMVTVLFADLSGFTSLAEKMDPEDLMAMMNRLWRSLDSLLVQRNGSIDKHMGDNVIALWGTQTAREDDAEQALRAALEMQAYLRQNHPQLRLHIAVHSGPVVLGEVGSQGEYTAIGAPVSFTSRMEKCTPAGEIYLSQETWALTRGLFETEELPAALSLSLGEDVRLYRLLRPAPRSFRPRTRGIEGVQTRMVGRQNELRILQSGWRKVTRQNTSLAFTIVGEAGLGKSRLLYEFEQWLENRRPPRLLLRGRATERSMNQPYGLLRDIFANLFDIHENDPLPLARQKLEEGILRILGPEAREKAHFIGHLLGLDFSESPFLRGILNDPRQIRERAFLALERFTRAVSANSTLVTLAEDLHWADSDSLEVFRHLVTQNVSGKIFFLGLARPTLFERLPQWGARTAYHRRITLQPLNPADSQELARELLQKMDIIPPRLLALVTENAEGNPFYAEELVKMLIDQGVIRLGERWQAETSRLGEIKIPSTLTGILQARLDGLPEQERLTLQCASVLGKRFWDEAVRILSGLSAAETHSALQALYARELIYPRQHSAFAGSREYIFKHAILRQVTYESVLKRQRRALHSQAAAWLSANSGQRAPELAALIAEHYEHAEDTPNAALWFGLAGNQAFEAYAPAAAVSMYRKALAFLQGQSLPPAAFGWLENLGKALQAAAEFDQAMQCYQQMLQTAQEQGNLQAQAQAWYNISFVQDHRGETRASLQSAQNAAQCAARLAQSPALQAKCLNGQGWAHYHLGEADQAEKAGQQALEWCQKFPSTPEALREKAQTYQLLGAIYDLRGQFALSIECEQQALETYRQLDDRRGTAAMLNNQGVGAFIRGDYLQAAQKYQEALALAGEIGSRDRESIFLSNLGGARTRLGLHEQAESDLRRAIALAGGSLTHYLPLTYCFLAEACLEQKKLEEAVGAAQQALALGEASQQPEVTGAAWRVLGLCSSRCQKHPAEKKLPAPEICFEHSLNILREIGAEAEAARTLLAWASWSGEEERRLQAGEILQRLGIHF